jgi:hypothetical protein
LKKFFILLLNFCILSVTYSFDAFAKKNPETESEINISGKSERYIKYVYDKLKFNRINKLSFDAFKPAYFGYLNMIEAGKISSNATLSVCDFTMSSNEKRLWVIDVKSKKILFNTLVAHGSGTGEEYATSFSNINDSHQSSLGFYVTGETYDGSNGYSLKLHGVDGNFNNNAFDRGIVIHAAEYVSEQFARENQRLGRSHGCPALPIELSAKIIDRIQNGHCLFIYHSTRNYLRTSYWLNNSIHNLPQEADMMDLNNPVKLNPRYVAEIKPSDICDKEKSSILNNTKLSNVNEVFLKTLSSEKKLLTPKIHTASASNNVTSTWCDDGAKTKPKTIIIVNINSQTGISDTTYVK